MFTCYRARIPWLDDARIRPDEILPRRCRLDLKGTDSDQNLNLFTKIAKRKVQSCASGNGNATDLERDMVLAVVDHLEIAIARLVQLDYT